MAFMDFFSHRFIQHRWLTDIKLTMVISKYFIRRFFRIYSLYVAFCSIIKFYPKFGNHPAWRHGEWTHLVTLNRPGYSHLWTIAPEIKYYFFIPLFTLFIYKTGKFSWITLGGLSVIAYLYDCFFFTFDMERFASFFPIFFWIFSR